MTVTPSARPAFTIRVVPALHVDEDQGDDPLIVLVHGSMDRGATFRRVRTALHGHHVIAYDRRGYAGSVGARPIATTLDDHVEDLIAVIDARPAVVAGHSYGADVALAAAIERPDLILAVVAYEPPMPWAPWWPTDSAGGAAIAAAAAHADPGDAAEAFMRAIVGDDVWDRLPPSTKDLRRMDGPALVAEMESIREPPAPFDPSRVPVPVIVATGSDSPDRFADSTRALASVIPGARLEVVADASHGCHLSHPELFAGLVRDALALT
ncbi:MAG: hypothetical protein QOG64_2142 [Acidimicrobiaceae bacterium]|nr:hypothetical protein [Acidimicrobiaceae bacterium]